MYDRPTGAAAQFVCFKNKERLEFEIDNRHYYRMSGLDTLIRLNCEFWTSHLLFVSFIIRFLFKFIKLLFAWINIVSCIQNLSSWARVSLQQAMFSFYCRLPLRWWSEYLNKNKTSEGLLWGASQGCTFIFFMNTLRSRDSGGRAESIWFFWAQNMYFLVTMQHRGGSNMFYMEWEQGTKNLNVTSEASFCMFRLLMEFSTTTTKILYKFKSDIGYFNWVVILLFHYNIVHCSKK